ncbi:MAG TPA: NAD/NADP octopine/nopaline dehydrogenase family protein [Azospirillum sp.]|nr:NAD/NADP octopine/nopaline dehydrogenase family protein [Azospirillum sp.]
MEIAVLGGGNGCYAAAADLSERGHRVRFWRRDAAALRPVLESRSIRIRDFQGERDVAIALPTSDIGAAVRGADLILVPTPAFAQADIAAAMAPHLSDGQVVFLPPGTFGSFVMMKRLRDAGCTAHVAFAETGTLPWLVRKHGAATVAITTRATRLPTGVFPAEATEHALAVIARAFPKAIERCEDALSGALMNAGPIIHPPLILMNAGPIEHFERWDIHNEGTQPSVRRVTDALDAERVAIREALGYTAPHFPLADHYDSARPEWMYGNMAHDKLVDSGDWRERLDLKTHRYMLEDVGHGLAFLVSVGEWAGVPCPVAAGLLALGSAVAERDFRRSGRTLKTLGLDVLDRAAMRELLTRGI